jgi:hypothetical protein
LWIGRTPGGLTSDRTLRGVSRYRSGILRRHGFRSRLWSIIIRLRFLRRMGRRCSAALSFRPQAAGGLRSTLRLRRRDRPRRGFARWSSSRWIRGNQVASKGRSFDSPPPKDGEIKSRFFAYHPRKTIGRKADSSLTTPELKDVRGPVRSE